jgi:hypothetical protein
MTAKIRIPEEALKYFRKTGRAGGLKRAENMTPEQRSEQARKAVQARWNKAKESSKKSAAPESRSHSKETQ